MNTRKVGAEKEEAVCQYLQDMGVQIETRNFRCRQGEIDIIGYDGDYLVFFEVKYRSASSSKGKAIEAVGYAKQQKICRVSDYYRMLQNLPLDTQVRYDVVAVDGNHIEWIQNAFAYCFR